MAKAQRMQPSRLRHARDMLIAGEPLSDNQRNMMVQLLNESLEDRQLDNSLSEFHKWIRLGDAILSAAEKELEQLRSLTSGDGETISKAALFEILDKYRNHKPKNDVDAGVNWVLDKVAEEVEKLYTV